MKRWPIILTGVIDTVYRVDHDASGSLAGLTDDAEKARVEKKIEEGRGIIEQISKLKYEMARDRPLECVYFSCVWVRETDVVGVHIGRYRRMERRTRMCIMLSWRG